MAPPGLEIARKLASEAVSFPLIKSQVSHILAKLGVAGRREAAALAVRNTS